MIRYTAHAETQIAARGIAHEWVEATLEAPDRSTPHPTKPDRVCSWRAIAAFGGRVLLVVHHPDGADVVVITTHFDRRARR